MFIFNILSFTVFAQDLGPGPLQLSCLDEIVGRIIQVLFGLAGFALVIMFIVGGFRILFSAGDPKSIESGRNILTWAFTGFGMVIISWFLLLLIEEVTGLKGLRQFIVPGPNVPCT